MRSMSLSSSSGRQKGPSEASCQDQPRRGSRHSRPAPTAKAAVDIQRQQSGSTSSQSTETGGHGRPTAAGEIEEAAAIMIEAAAAATMIECEGRPAPGSQTTGSQPSFFGRGGAAHPTTAADSQEQHLRRLRHTVAHDAAMEAFSADFGKRPQVKMRLAGPTPRRRSRSSTHLVVLDDANGRVGISPDGGAAATAAAQYRVDWITTAAAPSHRQAWRSAQLFRAGRGSPAAAARRQQPSAAAQWAATAAAHAGAASTPTSSLTTAMAAQQPQRPQRPQLGPSTAAMENAGSRQKGESSRAHEPGSFDFIIN